MNDGLQVSKGDFNAAQALIEANLPRRANKIAIIDGAGAHTYGELAARIDACGAALLAEGARPGDRVALCMLDSLDMVACFLGSIKAGLIPAPLNTLLQAGDYAHILADSGARLAVVSSHILDRVGAGAASAGWAGRIIASDPSDPAHCQLSDLARSTGPLAAAPADSAAPAFWLYSSGSTGRPKGVIHRHASLGHTADLFARQVLGLREDDVIYSAAKLFFAYGLGNALTFPLSVGATVVLLPDRPTPEVVWPLLRSHDVTMFFGVPTLYASMLAHPEAASGAPALRLCVSAGEPLPAEIGRRWREHYATEIIDGVGSTEMLHIFVSNRPGAVRHGASGIATPGYELRLVTEDDREAAEGELGELHVRGPSAAAGYWNQPEKSAATFQDGWVRTGDRFRRDEAGHFVYCGRADDMLKVSGIWVSPTEVEAALVEHEAVLEAAVVGVTDQNNLTRVKAYVVPRAGVEGDVLLAEKLKAFAKARLAPYKYPRQIEFVPELPKTATGKVRRHVLREQG
ncbi:benzoate-CoA ligase family protein [Phenylobacterium montanum]|uniref:Benzoate-CoA ligase family protein n=1 Tax=Phenylobacterium montanum TaxID=2823693 RepID=A0A975IXJ4_9CAUL|nr:benzoate-CoA ligase family protein [Caulobacter sp. S6]QUD89476.1 benzoate-CoA ligase family protein [Caulobacter sp. S6]